MIRKTAIIGFTVGLLTGAPLAGCVGTPTTESTGEYIDDTAITTKVKTALINEFGTSGFAIKVNTFKGTVQLSGFADTERQIRRATEIARGIDGVKSVKNDIILKTNR